MRDGDAYRIARVLRGDPADRVRSPLDEPGVDADEGDVVLAVNGRAVTDAPNLHALLAGRITSYNVCYTKLLRTGSADGGKSACASIRSRPSGPTVSVRR